MITLIFTALSFVIMLVFLSVYLVHRGLPNSISDTYYSTEKRWLFPLTIGLSVSLGAVPLFELTDEPYKFLSFFIIGGILFVSSAPAFKEELEGKVHSISAIIAGVSSLVWLVLMNGFPILAIVSIAIGTIDTKRIVFWTEVGLLSNIYYVLFTLGFSA